MNFYIDYYKLGHIAGRLLFLIFAALFALSSVAFAKPYGEKSRPDSEGDIVFLDGTATAWREGLTLTEEQKKAAVAVIFYAGKDCWRVLGVGLAQEQDGLAWCTDDANAYKENITPILCEADGDAGALTFTGDKDGSVNLEQIGAFLRENGIPDDTEYKSLYPAFYFAKNYAKADGSNVRGTDYAGGWYLPSLAELYQIWKSKETVDAASKLCGGSEFGTNAYWSSSQYASYDSGACYLGFDTGGWYYFNKDNYSLYVCAVRAFNGEEKTMTVRENLKLRSGEATYTQVLAVMSAGAKVRILELGRAETIDGIASNWVRVEIQQGAKDRDGKPIKKGTVGWCFGGYLE